MELKLKLKFNRPVMYGYINSDNEYIMFKGYYKGTDEYGNHYCEPTQTRKFKTDKSYRIVIPYKNYNPYNIYKSLVYKI